MIEVMLAVTWNNCNHYKDLMNWYFLIPKGKHTQHQCSNGPGVSIFSGIHISWPSPYIFLHFSLCLPVARRRCARERLLRWFSRWWMEQMAVSSALDTQSLVRLTHRLTHRLQNQSMCGWRVIFNVCPTVSVSLSPLALIYQRQKEED